MSNNIIKIEKSNIYKRIGDEKEEDERKSSLSKRAKLVPVKKVIRSNTKADNKIKQYKGGPRLSLKDVKSHPINQAFSIRLKLFYKKDTGSGLLCGFVDEEGFFIEGSFWEEEKEPADLLLVEGGVYEISYCKLYVYKNTLCLNKLQARNISVVQDEDFELTDREISLREFGKDTNFLFNFVGILVKKHGDKGGEFKDGVCVKYKDFKKRIFDAKEGFFYKISHCSRYVKENCLNLSNCKVVASYSPLESIKAAFKEGEGELVNVKGIVVFKGDWCSDMNYQLPNFRGPVSKKKTVSDNENFFSDWIADNHPDKTEEYQKIVLMDIDARCIEFVRYRENSRANVVDLSPGKYIEILYARTIILDGRLVLSETRITQYKEMFPKQDEQNCFDCEYTLLLNMIPNESKKDIEEMGELAITIGYENALKVLEERIDTGKAVLYFEQFEVEALSLLSNGLPFVQGCPIKKKPLRDKGQSPSFFSFHFYTPCNGRMVEKRTDEDDNEKDGDDDGSDCSVFICNICKTESDPLPCYSFFANLKSSTESFKVKVENCTGSELLGKNCYEIIQMSKTHEDVGEVLMGELTGTSFYGLFELSYGKQTPKKTINKLKSVYRKPIESVENQDHI